MTILILLAATAAIWVAAGNYKPTERTDPSDPRSVTYQLQSGVALYGGFDGIEIERHERNWATNVTIIVSINSY